MSTELYYIYDTHCPWSYASLPLVNEIASTFPDIQLHLWHCARYEGDENIGKRVIDEVCANSNIKFTPAYLSQLSQAKDSTLAANFMTWIEQKIPQQALTLLNVLFNAHFQKGNELLTFDSVEDILNEFKLSPPQKVFKNDKLTKDAEFVQFNINELQEFIGTPAIPALLLAVDDKLILLNHNLYLKQPTAIVDAIKLEMK